MSKWTKEVSEIKLQWRRPDGYTLTFTNKLIPPVWYVAKDRVLVAEITTMDENHPNAAMSWADEVIEEKEEREVLKYGKPEKPAR